MKYSAAVLSLAAVVAAQPAFTNLSFDVKEGEPFTLEFSGCDDGCTINLKNGPSDDLKTVEQLTDSATGGSFTFTPEDLPTDTYAFEIIDAQGEDNYSDQFEYEGVAAPQTSTITTEVVNTLTTSTKTSTTEEESTTSTSTSVTTMTTPETTVTETATQSESSSETATPTEDATESETSGGSEPTEIPDGGNAAAGIAAPGTLIFAAVAGLLMFN